MHVYKTSDYELRVRCDAPCNSALSSDDQEWASGQWSTYRQVHPELFPDGNGH